MSSCCENTIKWGCFSSCAAMVTDITATITGTWTAKVKFNGVELTKDFPAVLGQPIAIPNAWPEGLVLSLRLFKPDGTPFDNNCYSFKNIITVTP